MKARVAGLLFTMLLIVACSGQPSTDSSAESPPTAPVESTTSIAEILPTNAPTALPLPVASATNPSSSTSSEVAESVPTESPDPIVTSVPTAEPTITPTIDPGRIVNGLTMEQFVIMSPEVRANVRDIFARGQTLGRNPYRFSKLGDSTSMKPLMLGHFDRDYYNLGPTYGYLQPVIDYYAGSFDRVGVALRVALHSWAVFDPLWAYKEWCEPEEHMLECEFRHNNPMALFIRLGTNDSGSSSSFDSKLREIITYTIDQGVIPILTTKPDRFEGPEGINNDVIRAAAADFQLPLWELDLVAGTVPGRGLDEDDVHIIPSYAPHDYEAAETFENGHAMLDLTGLMMLEQLWLAVNGE